MIWHNLYALCLLLTFHQTWSEAIQGATCKFPSSLIGKPRWENRIQNERTTTEKIVTFSTNVVNISDFSNSLPVEVSYIIAQCVSETKYILKNQHQNNYHCIDIIQRSPYIFQWKQSAFISVLDSIICNDENLDLDQWPFVWPYIDKYNYETPPIMGGYTMSIYDPQTNQYLCSDYWIPPFLESECTKGEGMLLNFRLFECRGSLNMNLLQNVFSLGTWTQGDLQYSIITNADDLWPQLWLTQVQINDLDKSQFNMKIFTDIVCENATGPDPIVLNRYTWYLSKRESQLQCEDEGLNHICISEAAITEPCDEYKRTYCKKSCGLCQNTDYDFAVVNQDEANCSFIAGLKGRYNAFSQNSVRKDIIFTNDSMVFEDVLPVFRCFGKKEKDWLRMANRKPLVSVLHNGCRPRYICLEAEIKSDDVIGYRLSQTSTWEGADEVNIDTVCGNDMFLGNKLFTELFFKSSNQQLMVKKTEDRKQDIFHDCGTRTGVYLKPDSNHFSSCLVDIGYYHNGVHSILNRTCISTASEIDPAIQITASEDWNCITHFESDNDDFVIVESNEQMVKSDGDLNIKCWIFHTNPWSPETHLFVVNPFDCNNAIPNLILFGGYKGYLAAYKVDEPEELQQCHPFDDEDITGRTFTPQKSSGLVVSTTATSQLLTQNIPPSRNTSDVYQLELIDKSVVSGANHVTITYALATFLFLVVLYKCL